jgi:hypothetical protein
MTRPLNVALRFTSGQAMGTNGLSGRKLSPEMLLSLILRGSLIRMVTLISRIIPAGVYITGSWFQNRDWLPTEKMFSCTICHCKGACPDFEIRSMLVIWSLGLTGAGADAVHGKHRNGRGCVHGVRERSVRRL